MPWQGITAGLCIIVGFPVARGLYATHALECRSNLQPDSLVLARSLHRPLYCACLLLLLLRSAFLLLTAVYGNAPREDSVTFGAFWLLEMPSVALAGLCSYLVLFSLRLVVQRRWPGAVQTSPSTGILTATFVAFCASLTIAATLLAMHRVQGKDWGLVVPQWMVFGYAAVIWSALGMLLLKYQGQAVKLLWRYRRRYRWESVDGETRSSCRLPVLSVPCLRNLTIFSSLLAELLVFRGIVLVVMASRHGEGESDLLNARNVVVNYLSWETVCIAIVLRMLYQTPIAVHGLKTRIAGADKIKQSGDDITFAADTDHEGDTQIQFHMPSVRELVSDYVIPSNLELLSGRKRYRGSEYSSDDLQMHRYCNVHCSAAQSEGAEYIECRCSRDSQPDGFLSNANVPLLAGEFELANDGSPVRASAPSAPPEEDII